MDYVMQPYDAALANILENGTLKSNKRTGQNTLAIFGLQTRYRLDGDRFPIVTRRKVFPKAIFAELLWFLSGSTNNKDLQALGANIWTPWVSKEFEDKHGYVEDALGPVYGFNLRHFGGFYGTGAPESLNNDGERQWMEKYGAGGFDQLEYMLDRLKNDSGDRRIMFSLWNPKEMHKMRLPPCHYTYQLFVDDEGRLSGKLTQRSCDFPIGVPANIQFYSALTVMFAQQGGFTPYEFVHDASDAHIYGDQIEAVRKYLETPIVPSPRLKINKASDMMSYKMEDFQLEEFNPGPAIKIPVAV